MPSRTCNGCGAELELPADPGAVTFECPYCKREHRADDFATPDALAARELAEKLGRKLDGQAEGQRRLVLTMGAGLGVVVLAGVASAVIFMRPGQRPPSLPRDAAGMLPTSPPAVASPGTQGGPSAAPAERSLATVELTFGGEGTGPGLFDRAHNLAVDREGSVYVVDRTNRVQKFDGAGRLVATFRVETKNQPFGELSSDIGYAIGIAVSSKHELLVSIGYDIVVLDARDGSFLRKMPGTPNVICYRQITLDQSDAVYARSGCGDSHRYALVKLSPAGSVVHRYKEPPSYELASTEKVAVDGSGRVYAPHGYEFEIQVLSPTWEIFTRLGRRGDGPGEFSGASLGPLLVDGKGRLFAREASYVHVFDPAGKVLGRFDTTNAGTAVDLAMGKEGALYALTGKQTVARYTLHLP